MLLLCVQLEIVNNVVIAFGLVVVVAAHVAWALKHLVGRALVNNYVSLGILVIEVNTSDTLTITLIHIYISYTIIGNVPALPART